MYRHLTFPLLDFVAIPHWLLTQYMVPLLVCISHGGFCGVKWDRIVKEVYRNVIQNMAR